MIPRLLLLLVPCALVAGADLVTKTVLATADGDYHPRSQAWSLLGVALLASLLGAGLLPSRLATLAAGLAAGGAAGNVVSAVLHDGRVPNPFVLGQVAFNVADVDVLLAAPLLVVALARIAIRYREVVDRYVPPRRWERRLRRRLGL